ncbi:nucleotidyltransferase [Metabacillus sp. KIGAM252]|uniref:tRNA(Met) cytidine acetate ligase n=1 Tax=Metabacillus flavus TaxID=2823519 RepID=A0ABS5LE44_9BACI|nr:nucleotidyltransferase [Metabacillus flavus]MBS2968858.1 nucleotidyltransferase [Metabacillus flavus]
MNILGLIVEYNPFHNGHFYHMQESKKAAKADVTIAVMSGTFLQRGEPALLPKWERARMALEAGADLVVELPYVYSSQKASTFANGAVSILDMLGAAHLCFGSEDGKIEPFYNAIKQISQNEQSYSTSIKQYMNQGMSYPKALSLSFETINALKGELADLTKPNNILGFQYVSSILEQGSLMKAHTIQRTSAGYHDEALPSGDIASATSLRKAIFSGNETLKEIKPYVPESTYRILSGWSKEGNPFLSWERYFPYLQYNVLSMSGKELSEIYEVEEGLENRLKSSIKESSSFQELMERLKTKRYTWTRLQRMCVHVLTRTTKRQMEEAVNGERCPFIRVLGMNPSGQRYLGSIKKNLKIPLITNVHSFEHPALSLDLKAANIYAMGFPKQKRITRLKAEYATPPVRVGYEE